MSNKITRHAGDTYVPADAKNARTEDKEVSPSVGNSSLTSGAQPEKKDDKSETVNLSPAVSTVRRTKLARKDNSSVRSADDKQ